jgi:prepilin-type N-terminal cleavage/methylation domain-containing protein
MFSRKGFTLIELLIVIAIILILIAIALPNFLEAQLRAKTAKAQAEMRTLATAIEALRSERGVLLIDFWDDGTTEARIRINEKFAGAGHWIPRCSIFHPDGRSMECVYYPLTTPVAYLKSIPQDDMAPSPGSAPSLGERGHDEWIGHPGNRTYLYTDLESDPHIPPKVVHFNNPYDVNPDQFPRNPTPDQMRPAIRWEEFVLCGFGPGIDNNLSTNSVRLPFVYSPTNGTKSVGSLYFRSSMGIAR